jgi:hypothetical protein
MEIGRVHVGGEHGVQGRFQEAIGQSVEAFLETVQSAYTLEESRIGSEGEKIPSLLNGQHTIGPILYGPRRLQGNRHFLQQGPGQGHAVPPFPTIITEMPNN